MTNIIQTANFWELLESYQVEIPIIQRDYVQGREENKKIRQKIISKFKEASEGEATKLDFIYGNIKDGVFYPLDGQQRLTTLFLYHVYYALRDNQLSSPSNKKMLEKFTYSTRVSSKEFFDKLLESNISILDETSISEELKNENWFINYWNNDPSVQSALGMLDEIHEQCYFSSFTFNQLIRKDNRSITFEFLELEKFGLSDDLYIKMNARGKPLSNFENFKADLIGHIKKNNWETKLTYKEQFSTKIDGVWTDYFWSNGKNKEIFDTFFINFIYQFLITEIATRSELSNQIISNFVQNDPTIGNKNTFTIDDLLSKLLSGEMGISESFVDHQAYITLSELLDVYSLNSRRINLDFSLWIPDFTAIDELIVGARITYPNRVLHYAHSCYLLKNPNDPNNVFYNKWMRVVRNIVNNSTIDSVDSFRGVLQLIHELSNGSTDIHKYLSSFEVKSRFAERQVKEEIQKSKLLVQGLLNFNDLMAIEDCIMCYGRVEFVFYYISEKENNDYSKITSITNLFSKYFNRKEFTNHIRALFLTCGNGKFYEYWATSWVFLLELPKRCLIENTDDLRSYSFNLQFRSYFVELIYKLAEFDDIGYHLTTFRNSTDYPLAPIWKQKIISDPTLLDNFCASKMIAIADDDSQCYLLNVGKVRNMESVMQLN